MIEKYSTKTSVSWYRLNRKSITSNVIDGGKTETSGKDWSGHIYTWTEGCTLMDIYLFIYSFTVVMLSQQTEQG